MMILGEVWQRLMLLTLQPMAWVPSMPVEAAPVKSRPTRRRQQSRRR